MALANYSDLQTTVANYLHRSDLTAMIPDFITLAEAKMNRRLRIRAMENVTTGTVSTSASLPTGFLEMRSLTVNTGGSYYPLKYVEPALINADSGTATSYSIVGDSIYFMPTGSGETYTLTYYKKFDALSGGVNWLITNAPDAYLYATLLEAAPYIKEDARIPVWLQGYETVMSQLQTANLADRFGSTLAVKAA